MQIESQHGISFGYSSPLKTLWRKNKLPSVKYGFYGGILTQKNVTLEHLQPASKHGKTNLSNLVLATEENNLARGTFPLSNWINQETVIKYLSQFKDIKAKGFNGNEYIKQILNTLSKILEKEKNV